MREVIHRKIKRTDLLTSSRSSRRSRRSSNTCSCGSHAPSTGRCTCPKPFHRPLPCSPWFLRCSLPLFFTPRAEQHPLTRVCFSPPSATPVPLGLETGAAAIFHVAKSFNEVHMHGCSPMCVPRSIAGTLDAASPIFPSQSSPKDEAGPEEGSRQLVLRRLGIGTNEEQLFMQEFELLWSILRHACGR